MELDETALICISTIKDGDNFYSKLLNLKDASTGKDFFKKHTFVLGCAACRAAGKASDCHHMKGELPAWQSARKHKRIRAMMSDQKELMEQETMGIMQNKNKRAFAPELCDRLMNADPFVALSPPAHIFIAIDPNGGGDSDFAMCSAYYDRGTMIICGLESVNAKEPEEYFVVIVDHIKELQRRFPQATIVAMPENNLGFEASHIELLIRKQCYGRIVIMYEKDSVGFLTTHATKTGMYAKFKNYLQKDAIRFDREVSCTNPDHKWPRMKDTLNEQLSMYSIITELPKSAFGKIKQTYSGKVSAGAKDDALVCMQLNLIWYDAFYTDQKYKEYNQY